MNNLQLEIVYWNLSSALEVAKYFNIQLLTQQTRKSNSTSHTCTVTVSNLFYNIPVRRYYYKNQIQAISKQLQRFCFHFALANHGIKFNIHLNNNLLLNTGLIESRCPKSLFESIFGLQKDMIILDADNVEFGISGYVSGQNGGIPFQNASKLFIILNNKPIINEDLYQLVKKTFKEKSALTQPIGVIYLRAPNGNVDFNISADKTEARIVGENRLKEFLVNYYRGKLQTQVVQNLEVIQQTAVPSTTFQQKLQMMKTQKQGVRIMEANVQNTSLKTVNNNQSHMQHNQASNQAKHISTNNQTINTNNVNNNYSTPTLNVQHKENKVVIELTEDSDELMTYHQSKQISQPNLQSYQSLLSQSQISQKTEQKIDIEAILQSTDFLRNLSQIQSDHVIENEVNNAEIDEDKQNIFEKLQIIGQYNNSFIICHYNQITYLLDQHSLDEAIHFEHLRKNIKIPRQKLVVKQKLDLTHEKRALLDSIYDESIGKEWGFNVIKYDQDYYFTEVGVIDNKILTQQDFESYFESECKIPDRIQNILANRACKSSVRLGDQLNAQQMKSLLLRASECDNCFNCPHGRPSIQRIYE
ncbi:DNA_mismatch repair protein MutL [Hexamita inflata]|uniref:DNA mismatch repair protein MutL n=1 Tax=Hexamita inflata TaxID=28002 RepID=A0AA86Q452_9EUKA|nr:DNA mismatch repair protein MutL [Hexamita inflata]CAI9950241.1 DNA mismatch repair protein MutL [Hexamita inflata]